MNSVKNKFLEMYNSKEILDITQLIVNAENSGLLIEVIHTALMDMKENSNSTPLLSLQVAVKDWDV